MIKVISIIVVAGALVLAICHHFFPEVAPQYFIPVGMIVGAIVYFAFYLAEKKWGKKEPEKKP
ncbi:MAG TPA: hypothetical protein VHC44_17545 [Verrucomicrobiae bacterium]|nr:hypothetical protein [Verrucomicrobiae bacterium]